MNYRIKISSIAEAEADKDNSSLKSTKFTGPLW
jgi:hypothetical protein